MSNVAIRTDSAAVKIRRPVDAEIRACRMLLPDAFNFVIPSNTLIAVTEQPLRFIAAAAYELFMPKGEPTWKVWLHTIKTHRRQHIGSRLLGTIMASAQRRGVKALEVSAILAEEAETVPFLLSHGFELRNQTTTFEASVETFAHFLYPLRQRLTKRGKLPAGMCIVPLSEAPFDQVVRIHAEHIGGTREIFYARRPADIYRELQNKASVALMVDGVVKGIVLVQFKDDLAKVAARVVVPEYQGSSVNAMLMATSLDGMVHNGARCVQFVSSDTNRDTLKLAVRCQANVVNRHNWYRLILPHS